jgi:O-acetylserine/cysteine efflux transporter
MQNNALTGRDFAAAFTVVVLWGVNFVVMKFALRDFTPFQLGTARYVFAVLPLVLLIRPPQIAWKWVVFYGLFQGVGQFGILFLALKVGMTAALASVLQQTQVFWTALFGFVLLHERASRPLQAGNMFSNEPGIYIVGEFGIRTEDEMLITDDGARLLLPQAKSLLEIF